MKALIKFFTIFSLFFSNTGFAKEDSITLSGHPDYPPIIWFSKKDNTLKGVAVELVQEMFKEHKIKVNLFPVSTWGRAMEEVSQGRVDFLLPPYKTDERLKTYLFSDKPFLNDRTVLFVKKGSKILFTKPEDLKNYRGVAIINDSFGDEFDLAAKKNLKIQRLSKTSQSLNFLVRDRADYLVAGYSAGVSVARKEGLMNEIAVLPKDVISTGMYFAISKKSKWANEETLKIINQYISEKITEDKIKMLEDKYLTIYSNE